MKGDENVPVQQNDPYAKQKKSGSQGMADDIQHEFLVIPDFPVRNRKEEKGESVRSLPESLRGVHALNFREEGLFAFANSV